jgi:hypothetical protein
LVITKLLLVPQLSGGSSASPDEGYMRSAELRRRAKVRLYNIKTRLGYEDSAIAYKRIFFSII